MREYAANAYLFNNIQQNMDNNTADITTQIDNQTDSETLRRGGSCVTIKLGFSVRNLKSIKVCFHEL